MAARSGLSADRTIRPARATVPRAWDAGHGGALHDAALAHLAGRGFQRAVLWVLEGNTRAPDFYAARGWTDGGEPHDERRPGGRLSRAA